MRLTERRTPTCDLSAGDLLTERYLVEKLLGGGGMGAVYLVVDRVLKTRVALKVFHPELARDMSLMKRFLREVQLLNNIGHTNIIRTFGAGTDAGLMYFTMEYVDGLPVDEHVQRAGADPTIIARLVLQLCRGLRAIHNAHIVHRDLKPGNVLVSHSGYVKICDMGIAHCRGSTLTLECEVLGTLDYLAPEIALGEEVTPAADYYSLGIMLYEIATGSVPFVGETPVATVWMHVNKRPEPPSVRCPHVPEWLERLIMALIAKHPSERPQSMEEIIAQLRPHL